MDRPYSQLAAKIVLAAAVGVLIAGLYFTPLFTRLEFLAEDFLFKCRIALEGERPARDDIVMIRIDDASIAQIGRWPWSRDYHATMVALLSKLGAKSIIFDILFAEPEKTEGGKNDQVLAGWIKRAGNVYLPTGLILDEDGAIEEVLSPIPEFMEHAKGTGHITIRPDADGVIRRIPAVLKMPDGSLMPQIMLSQFLIENGKSMADVTITSGKEIAVPYANQARRIPIDQDYNINLNWRSSWKDSFIHFSFTQLLEAYNNYLKGEPTSVDLEKIKGATCIIGVTATGLYDIKPSPLEPAYPGTGMGGTLLINLVENDFVKQIDTAHALMLIFFFALATGLATSRLHPWRSLLGATVLIEMLWAMNLYALMNNNLIAPFAHPLAAILVSYIAATVHGQIKLMSERRKLTEAAERDSLTGLYNMRSFQNILRDYTEKNKSAVLSVVMCDIDHFKKINDTYGHQVGDVVLKRVATLLQSFSRTSDIVARYGGEEFILMVPAANIDQAWEIAEKLRGIVAGQQYRNVHSDLKTTMSFGVASRKNGESSEDFIRRADEALYAAKEGGRNKVLKAA